MSSSEYDIPLFWASQLLLLYQDCSPNRLHIAFFTEHVEQAAPNIVTNMTLLTVQENLGWETIECYDQHPILFKRGEVDKANPLLRHSPFHQIELEVLNCFLAVLSTCPFLRLSTIFSSLVVVNLIAMNRFRFVNRHVVFPSVNLSTSWQLSAERL